MVLEKYRDDMMAALQTVSSEAVSNAISLISSKVESGYWIFTCGNGGSALTASHYVTDWTKMALVNKKLKFKAMCLNDNLGMLTAYSNDVSYDKALEMPLESYGSKGDLLVVVSGSGNSQNVVAAVNKAKSLGIESLAIVGFDGGKLKSQADHVVHIDVMDMQISEDFHLMFGHMVMRKLCC